MRARRWSAAVVMLALVACSRATPLAAPTPLPQPQPAVAVASPTAGMDLGEDPADTATAFLDSLFAVLDEASAMAEASCDDLKLTLKDDPNAFRSVRGYAATLKRAAAQSPDLTADEEINSTLAELDAAMGQLDGALSLCGIPLS